ncbi:MAG: hypothetical protein ACOC6F_04250 [bacterium]
MSNVKNNPVCFTACVSKSDQGIILQYGAGDIEVEITWGDLVDAMVKAASSVSARGEVDFTVPATVVASEGFTQGGPVEPGLTNVTSVGGVCPVCGVYHEEMIEEGHEEDFLENPVCRDCEGRQ